MLITTADDDTIEAFNVMVRDVTDGQELVLLGCVECGPRAWGADVSHPRFYELDERFHQLKWPEATLLLYEVDYEHGTSAMRPNGKTLSWGNCDSWGSSLDPSWPERQKQEETL